MTGGFNTVYWPGGTVIADDHSIGIFQLQLSRGSLAAYSTNLNN